MVLALRDINIYKGEHRMIEQICDKVNGFIAPFIQMEASGTITYEKVLSLSNILDMVIYAMNEENQLFDPSQYCLKTRITIHTDRI